MRHLAGTDRIGTNLLGLHDDAEKLGFTARRVHGPADALPEAPLPAIAHVLTEDGLGHFVVLYRVDAASVLVADPAHEAVERVPRERFARMWTGYLLLLAPDHLSRELAGAAPTPWGRFLGLLLAHRGPLVEALLCALVLTVLGLAGSYFLQHLVDSVLVRHEERLLNAMALGMVLVLLFRGAFGVLRQYLLAHVGRKVDLTLISGYARHLLSLPLGFFETRRVGEILSRMHDAEKVREAVSGTTLTLLVDGILVTTMAVVLWLYDLPLAALVTAFVPLLVLSIAAHHPRARRLSREAMERAAQLSAHLAEDISGVEAVKAFALERTRAEEGEARLIQFIRSLFSLQMLGLSLGTTGLLITSAAGLAVLWYGGHRVMAGHLSIGQLMFFYSLVGYLLEPLERLASVNLKVQEAVVAVDRLGQVLDLPPEAPADEGKVSFAGVRQGLELEGVTFRYGHQLYGTLDGTVEAISPDAEALEDADGRKASVYVVRVRVDREEVSRGGRSGRVKIGMAGIAEIVTGRESVLRLLLKKIRQSVSLS